MLYVLLIMSHDRRRILHFNVTTSPFGPVDRSTGRRSLSLRDPRPDFLLRDRDSIFGGTFVRRVESMGIEEVVTAPGSPWQNPYCERLIGSIRRECLDHVIVLGERHLMRILRELRVLLPLHRERTGHWRTTARIRVRWNRPRWAMWSPSPRSAGSITGTAAGSLPDVPPIRGWFHRPVHTGERASLGAHIPSILWSGW